MEERERREIERERSEHLDCVSILNTYCKRIVRNKRNARTLCAATDFSRLSVCIARTHEVSEQERNRDRARERKGQVKQRRCYASVCKPSAARTRLQPQTRPEPHAQVCNPGAHPYATPARRVSWKESKSQRMQVCILNICC